MKKIGKNIGNTTEFFTSLCGLIAAVILLLAAMINLGQSSYNYALHWKTADLHHIMLSILEVIAALEIARLAIVFYQQHRVHIWLIADAVTVFLLRELIVLSLKGKPLWPMIGYLFLLVILRMLMRYSHPGVSDNCESEKTPKE